MSIVCIIGAGELGGATAHALARHERVRRVILIDDAAGVAAGKALDILQAGAVDGSHTQLEGSADLSRVVGAAVCVIADRSGRTSSEWQGDDGLALLNRLAPYFGNSPIVFAGSSQASLLLTAAREVHIRRERLIGAAPEALCGAVKSMVALEAQCSPTEIGLTLLGAPPRGFVVPWSEASIGGHALERVLDSGSALAHRGTCGTSVAAWSPRTWAGCGTSGRGTGDDVAQDLQRPHGPRRRIRRP